MPADPITFFDGQQGLVIMESGDPANMRVSIGMANFSMTEIGGTSMPTLVLTPMGAITIGNQLIATALGRIALANKSGGKPEGEV